MRKLSMFSAIPCFRAKDSSFVQMLDNRRARCYTSSVGSGACGRWQVAAVSVVARFRLVFLGRRGREGGQRWPGEGGAYRVDVDPLGVVNCA
jgi:hypothetical protein